MSSLEDVETLIFCDESKFAIKDGNKEDAIFYFGMAVSKNNVSSIHSEFQATLKKHKIQAKVYHSNTIFKESRTRETLMNDLCSMIVDHNLNCFCYKYPKKILCEPTKNMNHFNDGDILNFNNPEFQALFYFVTGLNSYIIASNRISLERKIVLYFDRNVYGRREIEAFNFPNRDFSIKTMTFADKSSVSLLALPDFFGYIFRKTKISNDLTNIEDNKLETSRLTSNCYSSLMKITQAKLFHFIDFDENSLVAAINTIVKPKPY